VPLLGELDCESECLRLPGLSEHRAILLAGQARKDRNSVGSRGRIRRAQGNLPRDRYK
jgi:hypothetical protein